VIDLDVATYSHRHSHWQIQAAESVARYTKQSYRFIQICEPGSAHVNLNRVLEQSTAPYLVILDEDASLVSEIWLSCFLQTIARPDVGLVGAFQKRSTYQEPPDLETHVVPWTPGYFMGIDRQKFPELRFDEAIPGANGMTDVDFCLQIRERELQIVQDYRIQVYHPQRDEDEIRAVEERPTIKQQAIWYHDQMEYMRHKWGVWFDDYVRSYFGAAAPVRQT
jgi:hypothetical protein